MRKANEISEFSFLSKTKGNEIRNKTIATSFNFKLFEHTYFKTLTDFVITNNLNFRFYNSSIRRVS